MNSSMSPAAVAALVLCLTASAVQASPALRLAQAAPADTPAAAPSPAPAAPAATSVPAAAPAPAATPAAATPAAAPAMPATGMAAWNKLVGNSITGQEDGKTLVEFYAADGTVKSMSGNEISSGKWALVGDTVCFKYNHEPKAECYKVEVSGSNVTYTDEKGSGTRYELLAGNPKGL